MTPARSVNSESINAPAAVTFVVSVTSALASIALSLDSKVSVKLFVSNSLNSAVLISEPVWSAVAPDSIPSSFVWSASVNTFESVADSTRVRISEAV